MKQTNIKKEILNRCKKGLILTDNFNSEDEFMDFLANKLADNFNFIIYKENNKTSINQVKLGKKIRQLCSIFNAILIVYDRVDIAEIINADGICLDVNSIEIDDVLKIYDKEKIIGFYIDNKNKYKHSQNYHFDFICTKEDVSNIFTQENTNIVLYKDINNELNII